MIEKFWLFKMFWKFDQFCYIVVHVFNQLKIYSYVAFLGTCH